MKYLVTIVFSFACLVNYAQINEIKKDATISSVTVFRNKAQIFRQATVAIKKGINKITITNLEKDIDPGSIQVGGNKKFIIKKKIKEGLKLWFFFLKKKKKRCEREREREQRSTKEIDKR